MREVFNVDRKEVKCAVFFWVCSFLKVCECVYLQAVLLLRRSQDDVVIEKETFLSQFAIDAKTFEPIVKKLIKTAGSLAQQIKAERTSYDPSKKVTPFSTPHASPQKSPSKTPLRVAPSNSPTKPDPSPTKTIAKSLFAPSTPSTRKSPSKPLRVPPTNDKRKEDNSPTKKRKLPSPQPAEEVPTQSPTKKRKVQTPLAKVDEDENPFQSPSKQSSSRLHAPFPQPQFSPPPDDLFSEEEPELAPQRRFRPVFLDAKQWASRDPRLESIARKADNAKRRIIEAHGHPFGNG